MADFDLEAMLEAPYKPASLPPQQQQQQQPALAAEADNHRAKENKETLPLLSREKERERERERERDSRRDRDRDRDRRDRHSHRSRSRSPHRRDRERERERDRRRSRSPPPRRLTREEQQQMDIERDSRTVFVMQLAARVTPRDIEDFFEKGEYKLQVKDVRLVTDRNTRKSKGVGYVEFKEKVAVTKAIAMSGTKLLGIPMIIQHTESEKNRIAEEAARQAALAAAESKGNTVTVLPANPATALTRLYVGSIDFTLTEDDIRSLFEVHGAVEFVQLHKDADTGRSRGFAFVQFKHPHEAKAALEAMHNYELKGRTLKVGYSSEADKNGLGAMGMNGSVSVGLEDEEKVGVAMSAQARAALMANLARRDDPSAAAALAATVAAKQEVTSRCVLLKNMFDPAQETEPNWDSEIRDDVKEECSKYGKIVHIAVDKHSQGYIYIKFDAIPFAQQAINALNGRFFAGKQISATFMLEVVYHAKYPDAAYL